ncbi:G-protein coupled receptor Mth2 [Cryptotermes secundus]|uniref:G-protein coupled receptor Mth2 n=1 Tax=Cryptotermes secundus TaxID=105785 RepID=A0A2J7R7H5_9NEOP|nr:G-protein coupled receptor Mth2 [Cryptotermes secundus]PNF36788.1 G-protein coupled receptor Mth2 [Cryptotermes secundus]
MVRESMEKVYISVCVLVVCAVFVAGPSDGSMMDPASSNGRISTEYNTNAGLDGKVTRVVTESSIMSRKQMSEKMERGLVVENRDKVDVNITDGKKLSAETFLNGITSTMIKGATLDEDRVESQTLVRGHTVDNSNTGVKNLESTTANYIADNENENKVKYTAANDFRGYEIQEVNNDTEIVRVAGNTGIDKPMELVVNNNSSSRDVTQLQADNVDSTTRKEKGLPMTTTDIQIFNKQNNRNKRNGNSIDDENIIESETEEMGSKNIMNKEYNLHINSTMACNKLLSVVITKWQMLANGSLLSLDDIPVSYPPELIWEDVREDNVTEVRGCICELRNCIRKCCPEGQTILADGTCVDSNLTLLHPFSPQFKDENNRSVTNMDVYKLHGNPCQHGVYRLDDESDEFTLTPTGVLNVPGEGNFTAAEYCIEAFENPEKILPLLCFEDDDESAEETEGTGMLYAVGMIISVPFLFATFLVYAMIQELRNLHGKSLMCHVSTLLTGYLFLAIVQLGGTGLSNAFCIFCAFTIFFAFHASFFWLNVMCFDIWWTFSGLRPIHGSVKEREHKKFIMYSIYAWGAPFIMLLVCMMLDLVPGIPDEYIKPGFGVTKCWFGSDTAVLAYFYGPIGFLVLCNIILFITTAMKIMKLKRETRMLQGEESKRHDNEADKQRFNLYLKLFIVMGVNWVMELISWAAGGPEYLWYLTDLGNTLQGVLIFIIFVWKRKILRLLIRRFRKRSSGSPFSSTTYRPTTSYTSTYSSTNDQFHMKPTGTHCTSDVP